MRRDIFSSLIASGVNEALLAERITANLPKHGWSDKLWYFRKLEGPPITHSVPGGRGKPRRIVHVPSHRLMLAERSKYPGSALRKIRARKRNFFGQVQR
jgi:hypothetical protein